MIFKGGILVLKFITALEGYAILGMIFKLFRKEGFHE